MWEIMTIRGEEYVESAYSIGLPTWKIIIKHILPNCLSPIIVQITLLIGTTIISASSLSFLGIGVPAPAPEWGAMLSEGREYMIETLISSGQVAASIVKPAETLAKTAADELMDYLSTGSFGTNERQYVSADIMGRRKQPGRQPPGVRHGEAACRWPGDWKNS